jgi:transcriptional regulator with XRE-family HTH domain
MTHHQFKIHAAKALANPATSRLRRARIEAGITLEELAQKTELSASTVRSAELGQHQASRDTLARLAYALDVDVADVIDFDQWVDELEARVAALEAS